MSCLRCVIKRLRSRPLNRDLTVEMRRGGLNHDRYNSFLFDTCADCDRWSTCPLHQRKMIRAPSNPTHRSWPHVLHLKYKRISPTRIKLIELIGFIMSADYKG